jgi:hypothetical protein
VAARVKGWSLVDGDGKAVEITPETVSRVRPVTLYKLTNIVLGLSPSDTDPQWKEETKTTVSQAAFDAVVAGTVVGQITEAAAEKNSA